MNDDARATLVKPSTIRFERLLPGPIERVWAYLTESAKRATWLAAGEFELRMGGKIELIFENDKLSDDTPKGGGARRFEGRITRLEPLRALGHTWGWDGKETEILSRCTDEIGQVQPTREQVAKYWNVPFERSYRVPGLDNSVMPWKINRDGSVTNGLA